MYSDDVARLSRDMDSRLGLLIGGLSIAAETDPILARHLNDLVAVRNLSRQLTDAADSGILPGPWPYPRPGPEPVHQCGRLALHVPDGAHAATDDDDDDPGIMPAPRWQDRLVYDFSVSEDSPVVKGTWVTVASVVSLIVDGWAWHDILKSHRELTEDDIRACLAYSVETDADHDSEVRAMAGAWMPLEGGDE